MRAGHFRHSSTWIVGLAATAMLGALARPAGAAIMMVNWNTLGTGQAASVSSGGITVTGNANVSYHSNSLFSDDSGGLGIAGTSGGSNSVDLGETITFDFGSAPVTNVSMDILDIDPPGNVSYSFEAFNGASSLGTFAVPMHTQRREIKNLTALDGGQAFTKVTFSLSQSAPFGLVFESTSFEFVPEPGSIGLALSAVGTASLLRRRRR